MDWLKTLDVEQALLNVRKDLVGDWYRDPWSWPEYEYVRGGGADVVLERARMSGVRRVALIDVPKENYATRPAVVMDPIDRLLYQALVDRLSRKLIGGLSPSAYGWRLPRTEPASGHYSPNDTEWKLYRGSLSGLATLNNCGLKTDIVSCFASLPVDRVAEEVILRSGTSKVSERLVDILRSFDGIPGRRGLPQRSKASSALANMFLMRLDAALEEHIRQHESHAPTEGIFAHVLNAGGVARWMDDYWVFGRDEATLRSAQLDLQNAARDAQLELNMGKTEVLEGQDLIKAALSVQHSAIDDALDNESPDVGPLEELLDQITDDPLNSSRSSIHFALERMRRLALASRRDKLITAAPRMPHGADHLARAFRDLGWWEDLQEWYLEYEKGPWGKARWSVASLGSMFPTSRPVSKLVRDRFAELLAGRPAAPMFALCSQRLVSWDRAKAKAVLRSVLPTADHPFERRIIGLAALLARDERAFIRAVLKEYDENAFLLKVIEARDFRPFKPAADFAAG